MCHPSFLCFHPAERFPAIGTAAAEIDREDGKLMEFPGAGFKESQAERHKSRYSSSSSSLLSSSSKGLRSRSACCCFSILSM